MIGVQGKDMVGKTMTELFPADFADKITADDWAVVTNGEVVKIDENLNGRSYNTLKYPIVIGENILLAGYTIDVTERVQAELANQETLTVLKSTLEATDNGILVVAEDGKVIHSNRRFAELWRIPEDLMRNGNEKALLDHVMEQLVDPQSFLRGVNNWYASFNEESGHILDFKDGRILERSSYPMVIDGTSAGRVWSFRDITERNRSVEALEISEKRFRDIAENAQEWIWEIDTDGRYTYVSRVAETILGYTPEEILQHHFYEFFHPDDREVLQAGALAAIASKHPFQGFVNRNIHKDGRTVWLTTSGLPLFDAKGNLIGYRGVDSDITELKQAEETLRRSEERFKLSMEATNDGLWDWNIETNNGYFSPAYYRMLGYEVGAFSEEARSWEELIHHDDRESVIRANNACIEGQCEHFEVEYRMKNKGGGWRWILGRGKCVARNEQGRALRMVGTHVDITERKRAEEALRESEEKFSKVFRDAPVWIAITDMLDATYQDVNEAVLKVSGFTRDEVVGHTAVEIGWIKPEDRTRLMREMQVHDRIIDMEMEFRSKDGRRLYGLVNGDPMVIGDRSCLVTITVDITDRKRMEDEKAALEAQLQQAQKMEYVGRLAGGVAHDFNNMLGVILGYTDLAMMKADPSHPLQSDLAEIRDAATRSAELTRQLLTFARKQTMAPKVLDMNDTVAGMLKMLRRLIGEDVNLAWEPGNKVWPVKMDPSQIDQILANLCVNARDAIVGGGKVTIETRNASVHERCRLEHAEAQPGDFVMLAVSDSGHGMDKDTIAQIFEPFFTTKDVGEGTGLGLATVYGAVKQNNGFIHVISEPERGTTFQLYFPRYFGDTEQLDPASQVVATTHGQETVLLVEDEPAILTLGKRILEQQGYLVLSANGPRAAIQLAEKHIGAIQLLVTDVVMPEMNGRDLVKHLLERYQDMKHLYMSGYPKDVIAHHGVLDEGVHFIQKPFTMRELAVKVRDALNQ